MSQDIRSDSPLGYLTHALGRPLPTGTRWQRFRCWLLWHDHKVYLSKLYCVRCGEL